MAEKVIAQQVAEWARLTHAVLYTPSSEVAYAQISPIENLYDDVIKLSKAQEEHLLLKDTLRKEGVKVYELSDLVKENTGFRNYIQDKIESLYKKSRYAADPKWSKNIRTVISGYPLDTLWMMAVLRPEFLSITEEKDFRARSALLHVHPFGNLFYMRDQQFVTDKGLVLGSLKMPARMGETELTEMGFSTLGIKPVHIMKNPMEGGDFLPAGNIAFLGHGYRNTQESVSELLESGALGYETIAVVTQPANQETMHLDTYFNILGPNLVVGDRKILRTAECTVYVNGGKSYRKTTSTKFFDFLKANGFDVLEVDLEKERFSTNFLALKENKILMPTNDKLGVAAKRYEAAGVEVLSIEVNELLAGYGGVHCMTGALRRE